MNRLQNATSPYLLQHAGNPVHWWPWCDEAFELARQRDVPVLLSVGYSACHWCHVMAHESFEDPATAALMNGQLVSIKVDREERPDVDAIYMAATQALTGQGGWPMTVFMTADREPFYCGTYFPRATFQQLIRGVTKVWQEDRAGVTDQAKKIAEALAERASGGVGALRGAGSTFEGLTGDWDPARPAGQRLAAVSGAASDVLAASYDGTSGGFGGAPKFPPSMVLEFLLRQHTRADPGDRSLRMATQTMTAMARGGMYDQLGGGFARYSVDAAWVVPHFEKMLYDNALLARDYAHLWRLTSAPLARRVAEETCDWMVRELRTAEGGLASALDADSEGEEGKFYVWTPAELTAVLGRDDGKFAVAVFGVTAAGTFERSRSVLQLPADPDDLGRFGRVRAALLVARERRVRPGRDDKVVAAWNGLAIAALAETGLLLGRHDLIQAATDVASLLARVHMSEPSEPGEPGGAGEFGESDAPGEADELSKPGGTGEPGGDGDCGEAAGPGGIAADGLTGLDGAEPAVAGLRLARTSRDGVAGPSAGLLEDYACVAEGFLVLAGVTGEANWAALAGRLLETALARFADGRGGFFDTADDGEPLLYRPADPADNATPSGAFAVAGALLSYAALTGSTRHRDAAMAALGPLEAIAGRFPQAAGSGLAVAEALLAGPAEIAIAGPSDDPRTAELHTAALRAPSPGAVIALGDGTGDSSIPLLVGRGLVDGNPAAYVCRNFTCQMPVTDPAALVSALSGRK